MNRPQIAVPALLLALFAVPGCGSDSATQAALPALLQIEGTVASDAWGEPLQAPVLVRVFRPDGRGGWNETEPDAEGRYVLQVEVRDGCEEGSTLEAAGWIVAPDHLALDEDLGQGRPVACDPEPQSLDFTLYRNIFRTPVPVAGELAAAQVSSWLRKCAINDDGAYCWGAGAAEPEPVPGGADFQFIAVGLAHVCALDGTGAAWCWGTNQNGALGVPGLEASDVPVAVETDLRFVALAANHESTCGLEESGELHCWGMYGDEIPVPFGGDLRFEQISGRYTHMCGVDDGGDVHCWGADALGETGLEESGRAEEPVQVTSTGDFTTVSAGLRTTCAVTEGGGAWCWGWNCDGQLGTADLGNSSSPVPVEGAPDLVSITSGFGFTCGLTDEGEVWCWGLNSRGQLGAVTENPIRQPEPTRVSGGVLFSSISAGHLSTCGRATDGRVHCWGDRAHLGTGLPLEPGGPGGSAAQSLSLLLEGGGSCARAAL